jgi:hypothetical protein
MANRNVRAVGLDTLENGRPVAPGDEISVSEREAARLVEKGTAIYLPAAIKQQPKKAKEVAEDAPARS